MRAYGRQHVTEAAPRQDGAGAPGEGVPRTSKARVAVEQPAPQLGDRVDGQYATHDAGEVGHAEGLPPRAPPYGIDGPREAEDGGDN